MLSGQIRNRIIKHVFHPLNTAPTRTVLIQSKGGWSRFQNAQPVLSSIDLQVEELSSVCFFRRHYSTSNDSNNQGPKKVINRRPRGIVPIGEDYGGYNEDRHEEYEEEAEKKQARIRWFKKIFSTIIFSSVLGLVVWARNKKQRALDENIKDCTFLKRDDMFSGSENSFCVVEKHGKVILPASLVNDGSINHVKKLTLRPGDLIVASFPKTGTTWVQEIVYLIENHLDFSKAKASVLEDRFPYLEYPYPGVKSIEKMDSPRLIKTHLPYTYLPSNLDQAKVIYITRNPKDTVVSYYHFARMLSFLGYIGSFDEFVRKFQNDQLPYTPFFGHLESYLNHKDDPNVLILTYEELSKDPAEVVQKIASFMEKPLTSDEVTKIVEHTKFDEMAINPSVNYQHWDDLGIRKKNESLFMRKGKVGDWQNYLNLKESDNFDSWIKEKNSFNFKFSYNP